MCMLDGCQVPCKVTVGVGWSGSDGHMHVGGTPPIVGLVGDLPMLGVGLGVGGSSEPPMLGVGLGVDGSSRPPMLGVVVRVGRSSEPPMLGVGLGVGGGSGLRHGDVHQRRCSSRWKGTSGGWGGSATWRVVVAMWRGSRHQ